MESKTKLKRISKDTNDIDTNAYNMDLNYKLVDLFFEQDSNILIKHQIDSYNQFIYEIIPSILAENHTIYETIIDNKFSRIKLKFEDFKIEQPMMENDEKIMYPNDAIQKNLSYWGKTYATITQIQEITDIATDEVTTNIIGKTEVDYFMGHIPIMVGSDFCSTKIKKQEGSQPCKYSDGGQFIIKGSEKVILSVVQPITRKPMIQIKKEQSGSIYTARIISKSFKTFIGNPQNFILKMKKDNSITVTIPHFKEISVFVLLRALGLERDQDIINVIRDEKYHSSITNQLQLCINTSPSYSKEKAREILIDNIRSSKEYSKEKESALGQKTKHLERILEKFILPHIESETGDKNVDLLYKAYYICYTIQKLITCYVKGDKFSDEFRGCDDKDFTINQTVLTPGVILGQHYEQLIKKVITDCSMNFLNKNKNKSSKDDTPNIISFVKAHTIEQGMRQGLTKGEFKGLKAKGAAQVLNRLNYIHTNTCFRKVMAPSLDPSASKITGPRQAHPSHYGFYDSLETPEGHKTGLIKNLALTTGITLTNMLSTLEIIKYLKRKVKRLDLINPKDLHNYTKVLINYNWIGSVQNPIIIKNNLEELKNTGEISRTTSISLDYAKKELIILTTDGRSYRPVLKVENNKLLLTKSIIDSVKTFTELLEKYPNVVEFKDSNEFLNVMLADFSYKLDNEYKKSSATPSLTKAEINKINRINRYDNNVYVKYTHCEIHPALCYGLISTNIPFTNHTQSPRGIYQFAQAKQAMGISTYDFLKRTDLTYYLCHTQIPIVASRIAKVTNAHNYPTGENALVATASYLGYNQDDSLIANKSSIDIGFMRAEAYKREFSAIEQNQTSAAIGKFTKPEKDTVDLIYGANYSKLNDLGYVPEETQINNHDIIIGKVNPKTTVSENEKPYKDNSTMLKSLLPCTVDMVIRGHNNEGFPLVKMRIRSERIPRVGDKFTCYDEETQVLTKDSWKYFKDLKASDLVANVDSGKIVYETPSEIVCYKYEGPMISINNSNIDLKITPNHRMWVSNEDQYNFLEAKYCLNRTLSYQKSLRNDLIIFEKYLIYNEAIERQIELCQHNVITEIQKVGDEFILKNTENSDVVATDYSVKNENCTVYCCTVRTGLLVVKRNDKIVLCGNSRHGQKNTIGNTYHRAYLLYTKEGLYPNIIVNPNGIPKRMTIGQLVECLLAKVCVMKGIYGDGTPFMKVDIDKINKDLVDLGFKSWGNHTMYNGMNGVQIEQEIFFGPIYYLRLKQMVADKMHARTRGPCLELTHQPTPGRSRDGGLRLGTMEVDALMAHGIMLFAKEALVDKSDICCVHICNSCGGFAHYTESKQDLLCKACNNTTNISKVIMPYIMKLFSQECLAMGIHMRFRTTKTVPRP